MFEEQIKCCKLASNGDISSSSEKPIYSLSQQIKALSAMLISRPEGLHQFLGVSESWNADEGHGHRLPAQAAGLHLPQFLNHP